MNNVHELHDYCAFLNNQGAFTHNRSQPDFLLKKNIGPLFSQLLLLPAMKLGQEFCPQGGGGDACRGHAWQRGCVHGGGHEWQGQHATPWQILWPRHMVNERVVGVCMAGGMHGRGSMQPPGRYYGHSIQSMSGQYTSYWNAFLFSIVLMVKG